MKLAQLQELFYARVTGSAAEGASALDNCVVGDAALSSAQRLQVYADMYLRRLLDALREDFPKLAALVSGDAFSELGAAYVRAHPSEHHDIGRIGRQLPSFLRAHPTLSMRADTADLAELEWARASVFQESSRDPVQRDAVSTLLSEQAPNVRIELVPSLRLLRLEHDVVNVFRALNHGSITGIPIAMPTDIVVWRHDYEVFHARVEPSEAAALERAQRRATLTEICEAFAGEDDPVRSAYTALASWIEEGFIAAILS